MGKRIMLVDDEPDFTCSLRALLGSSKDYEVREVNDSRIALDEIRNFQPDLILMDIMMPGIDGSELVAEIRADRSISKIPVVYLTALVTKQEMCEPSFGLAHRHYLPKAVQWEELVDCIERETDSNAVESAR
jgi:CheY-like chemotaxis protein